jgi:putative SOS response-associated peptidase YedK
MCGRYASTSNRARLLEQFDVDEDNAAELKGPDYNVAPTKVAPVVIARAPSDGPKDADPVRQLRLFKWALLPDQLRRSRGANLSVWRSCPDG